MSQVETSSQPELLQGSEGDPRAELWAIARDWGEAEQRDGQPLIGEAGRIFDDALTTAGVRRQDIFIDNVVRKQPPANDWDRHDPADIAAGQQRLRQLLQQYKPKLVITLGEQSFRVCMGEDLLSSDCSVLPGPTEARGYLWDSPLSGGRLLSTVHPSFCNRVWVPWRVLFDLDFKKAAEELRLGCPDFPTREVEVVYSSGPIGVEDDCWAAYDIENYHEPLSLACLGIADSIEHAWVLPATKQTITPIRMLCEIAMPKVLQNGQYDRFFLKRYANIALRRQVFDTQLAFHALMPEIAGKAEDKRKKRHTQKSLRFLASIFTRDPYWKDYDFATEEERWELCGRDCCITLEVAFKLKAQLEMMT